MLLRNLTTDRIPMMQRAVAVAVTLAWLFSVSSIAPALTSLVGLADRAHHLAVDTSDVGTVVILHHEHPNLVYHHHGLVARILVVMAEQSTGSNPDHVIQFVPSAPTELTAAISSLSAPNPSIPPGSSIWQEVRPFPSRIIRDFSPASLSDVLGPRSLVRLI